MTHLKLAHVHRFRVRHGKVRHYFRRDGKRTPLPGLPGSAEFMAAYHAALAGQPERISAAKVAPGTMAAPAAEWLGSADFRALSPAEQRNYRRIVDRFLAEHGHRLVADLEGRHARRLLDARGDAVGGEPAAVHSPAHDAPRGREGMAR
jgi:hypothetical protein